MDGETFGQWLTRRMIVVGLPRPADLHRATTINASLIGRWMKDESLPGMQNIGRMAPALRVSVEEIAAKAGHLAEETQVANPTLPLISDVSRLLDPDGPVPPDQRATLTALIEAVVAPYMHHLRGRRAG